MARTRHLCLTLKQIETIKLALRSAEYARTKEKDRAYLRKVLKDIGEQVP